MTNILVDSEHEVTGAGVNAENLTTTDNLFVSSTGSLIAEGTGPVSGVFLDATCTANNVVIDGEVYCAAGDAVFSESANLTFVANGDIFGGVNGMDLSGLSKVTIGAQSTLSAADSGILLESGATNSIVTVDGTIAASQNAGIANSASGVTLFVNGTISAGSEGLKLLGTTDVTVSGTITSATEQGIYANAVCGITIDPNGFVSGANNSNEGKGGGIFLDFSAQDSSVNNAGTIATSDYGSAIYLIGTGDTISNTGTISSNHYALDVGASSDANLFNSGTIVSTGYTDAIYVDTTGSLSVHNNGTIDGGIEAGDESGIDLSNSGRIMGGEINLYGGAYINNSGSIDESIRTGISGTYSATITNSGIIRGEVGTGNGANTLHNSGTITGPVSMSGTGDTLINGGQIHGTVAMGIGETVTNTGTIHGDVIFIGGANTFDSSHGEVTGTVTGGTGADTLIGGAGNNTFFGGNGGDTLTGGVGDDTLNGGGNNDTLIGSRGDDLLTGGGGIDTFKFSGNFGNDTITDFTAGSATGHDVINFSHNDFASFSAVQAHMAQAGSDVVITFSATDSIVLQHVTLAHLVSADFTFG